MKTTGLDIREAVKATEAGNRVKRQIFFDYDIGHEEWASYKLEGDDLLADDWEIVPDPPKTMGFMEAWEQAKQGKKIARLSWANGVHAVFDRQDGSLIFCLEKPSTCGNQPRTLFMTRSYIDATDWFVVED